MARATAERNPATAGNTMVVLVTLAALGLLFLAFLGNVKSGNLLSEANLLYVSLIFYSAATALYLGFGVTGIDKYVRFALGATWIGFLANTAAFAHRWYLSGHPPFSNIYEMMLSFVWTLAALTLFAERKYAIRVLGTVTMPLAVVGVVLMQLLPSAVKPLVPALQSTWLHVHVTFAMLAYAACAVSFALAMMFLIQDEMKTDSFLATTSLLVTGIYVGLLTRFAPSGGLRVMAWDPQEARELFLSQHNPLMVIIPELGFLFAFVLLAVLAPLALYGWAKIRKDERALGWANNAFYLGLLLQIVALAAFVIRARGGSYTSLEMEGVFQTSLSASPFILSGLISGVFASIMYLMLYWRREDLERLMPAADRLDRLTYKTIGIAFPLLTLMIAAGAYWANRTWGSYWSWDPKETWAAITWLVYAGYLHMRITRGWRGRRAAYFAILGFAVVVFTFFGVTYLLPGLHAYA